MAELTHHLTAEQEEASIENQKFAMWLYIASETILFSIFIGAYAVFRAAQPEAVKEVHHALGLFGTLLVTFNSFLLLASSWAMVMGLREIKRGNREGMIRWLWAVVVLGTIFVLLQYVEYSRLAEEGVTLYFEGSDSPFAGFGMHFYTPTAFHGAHVIAGVIWCLIVIVKARNGAYDGAPGKNHAGVEIFGLYWHFVDVVWVVLFTLIYLV